MKLYRETKSRSGDAMEFIELSRNDADIAILKLNRPKANALSPELLIELKAAADSLHEELPRGLVVWGGEKIFAAGADISRFGDHVLAREIGGLFHAALNRIAELPRPTVAAIAGYALGGGCELALACDFRVASPEAKLGQPEILLGIIPGGGGTQRLSRTIGIPKAKELIFSGRSIDTSEALAIGLIDSIAPSRDELLASAISFIEPMANGASTSIGLAKAAIDKGFEVPIEIGLTTELDLFAESFKTQDAKIGVTSFLENGPGKAQFTGK